MSINFPANPTVGQTFEAEGLSFIWTGELWAFNDGTGVVTNGVPRGGIMMWSGAISAVPVGWVLCDGTNGTPDLRDRFIVGAGGAYAVSAVGGAASVTLSEAQLPAHDHDAGALAAVSGGAHTHTFTRWNNNAFVPSSGSVTVGHLGSNGDALPQLNTGSAGAHTHTISGNTANAGSGQSHENRPPYLALAYIMKT